ncbi:TatD family hydrolase [Thermodesulforhabdus norvegica]|uniref:TatD DNase family protein n=1 Tax=Thermodesulforhabdus norvegica TaxID=39841 RepID=A0A1I4SXU5_9BACT|nr:TatD family hydrolase [Thermodesulforhabdus norvegica]SFM69284.1 TatD DNase family protein [Thermodesulforhabdus norvegica]
MYLIDTHAHLDMPELFPQLTDVLDRAKKNNLIHIVTVGINLESSHRAADIAETHSFVSATAGIHPHGAHDLSQEEQEQLVALLEKPRVVALGETGLDFYRNYSPRDDQIRCFGQQLDIAVAAGKPVVFHIREAFQKFFEILRPYTGRIKAGIVHCFSGDWPVARRCLDMGLYLSIPGVVTYPKAVALQEVVKKAPLERLLVETDAPFLTPAPFRGKVNEPAYVVHTARKIAELRKEDFEKVAHITTENAMDVFKLGIRSEK